MTGPARRRPGGASPLLPVSVEAIQTTPHIEEPDSSIESQEATTPALSLVSPQSSPAPAPPAASENLEVEPATFTVEAQGVAAAQAPTLPASSTAPAMSVRGDYPAELDEKKQATLNLRRILKARAETVVLRTAGFEGGYSSWNSFVEGALERELQRMADKFNHGEPFPPNNGSFRQGRPLGS